MPAPTFATHTRLAVKNFTAKMGRYWKNFKPDFSKISRLYFGKFEVRFDVLFWILEKI